jgi:hypothetical protein
VKIFGQKTEEDITVSPSELYEKAIRSKRPEIFFFSFNTKNDDGLICACAIKLKKSRFFLLNLRKKNNQIVSGIKEKDVFKKFA